MKKMIFATGNLGKIREIKAILEPFGFDAISLKEAKIDVDIEENGTTFEENALIKASQICKLTGEMVMADDSGLEVDFLDKQPGVYSARFLGENTSYDIKNQYILDKLNGVPDDKRTARYVCAIALCIPGKEPIVVRDTLEGIIAKEMAGSNGFGYDPIFYLPEFGCTDAELTMEQKNEISHRAKAIRKAMEEFNKLVS